MDPQNSLIKTLKKVELLWNGVRLDSDQFLANLEAWLICRHRTLLAMEKFQYKFDKIHLHSSCVRAVGNGTALLGSLATVVGFGMSFSKDWNPIGKELMKYGSTVGSVGGATAFTASLVECGFNVQTLNNLRATLEEDSRQTEELLHWFKRNKELDTLLREGFGCGVANISEVLTVIRAVSVICARGGKDLNNVRSYLSALTSQNCTENSILNLNDKKLEATLRKASYKVKLLLKEFCDSPEVRSACLRIYYSFKNNPIFFELSKMSVRIVGKAVVQEIAFSGLFASADCRSLLGCVDSAAQGIFRTINIALSILAFLSSVDDIKNGKSRYSKIVNETRDYLLMELKEVESYKNACIRLKKFTGH